MLRTSYWERQTSTSEMHIPLSSQLREKKQNKQGWGGKRQHWIPIRKCKIHFCFGKVEKTFCPFLTESKKLSGMISDVGPYLKEGKYVIRNTDAKVNFPIPLIFVRTTTRKN